MFSIIAASLLVGVQTVLANPAGPSVPAGGATITASPSALRIDQNTKIVIINWQSFNIGACETTRFVQPDAGSVAVNRIGGADPARILGNLAANGRVILIDGNGIVFGPDARVDVGSLVATAHDAADRDLMSGKANFDKPGSGLIINNGRITANSGMVGLIASSVTNNGIVSAKLGQIVLGAARSSPSISPATD